LENDKKKFINLNINITKNKSYLQRQKKLRGSNLN